MEIQYACVSDPGRRETNQDFYAHADMDDLKVFAVADGCGAYKGSELASKVLCQSFVNNVKEIKEQFLSDPKGEALSMLNAAAATMATALVDAKFPNAATTFAATCFTEDFVVRVNVGDTRIIRYNIDKNTLWRTTDHTEFEELLSQKLVSQKDYTTHPSASMLTNVIDSRLNVRPDITMTGPIAPNELYVLSTDGIWPYCNRQDWRDLLKVPDLLDGMENIIDRIISKGADDDNMTAIVIRLPQE